jgi:hypothetical protein
MDRERDGWKRDGWIEREREIWIDEKERDG